MKLNIDAHLKRQDELVKLISDVRKTLVGIGDETSRDWKVESKKFRAYYTELTALRIDIAFEIAKAEKEDQEELKAIDKARLKKAKAEAKRSKDEYDRKMDKRFSDETRESFSGKLIDLVKRRNDLYDNAKTAVLESVATGLFGNRRDVNRGEKIANSFIDRVLTGQLYDDVNSTDVKDESWDDDDDEDVSPANLIPAAPASLVSPEVANAVDHPQKGSPVAKQASGEASSIGSKAFTALAEGIAEGIKEGLQKGIGEAIGSAPSDLQKGIGEAIGLQKVSDSATFTKEQLDNGEILQANYDEEALLRGLDNQNDDGSIDVLEAVKDSTDSAKDAFEKVTSPESKDGVDLINQIVSEAIPLSNDESIEILEKIRKNTEDTVNLLNTQYGFLKDNRREDEVERDTSELLLDKEQSPSSSVLVRDGMVGNTTINQGESMAEEAMENISRLATGAILTSGGVGAATGVIMERMRKVVGPMLRSAKYLGIVGALLGSVMNAASAVVHSEEWGVNAVSAALGGIVGGSAEGGIVNALLQGGQGAAVGATFGGPIGAVVGGILGAAFGFIGSKEFAQQLDNTFSDFKVDFARFNDAIGNMFNSIIDGVVDEIDENTKEFNQKNLEVMKTIDEGGTVPVIEDVYGYQQMSPEERKFFRKQLEDTIRGDTKPETPTIQKEPPTPANSNLPLDLDALTSGLSGADLIQMTDPALLKLNADVMTSDLLRYSGETEREKEQANRRMQQDLKASALVVNSSQVNNRNTNVISTPMAPYPTENFVASAIGRYALGNR